MADAAWRHLNEDESGGDDVIIQSSPVPMQDVVEAVGTGRYQWLMFIVLSMCVAADGMEMIVVSLLEIPLKNEGWIDKISDLGPVAACIFIGVAIGSYVFGIISDRWGRRKVLIVSMCFVSVFGALSAAAPNLAFLALCRFGAGIGFGGCGPSAMALYSEFVPPARRGAYLIMMGQAFSIGQVMGVAIGYLVMGSDGTAWRPFLAWSSVPAVVATAAVISFIPESPRFLCVKGDQEALQQTFSKAARSNGRLPHLDTVLTGRDIVMHTSDKRGSIWDLLQPGYRGVTLCLWLIWIVQNFVYYGLIFLLPSIVRQLDKETGKPISGNGVPSDGEDGHQATSMHVYMAALLSCCVELPGAALAAGLTDWKAANFGRRRLLAMFMIAAGVGALLVGFVQNNERGVVAFALITKMFINGSFGLVWTFTSEIYPTTDRATGLGAASAVSRIGGGTAPTIGAALLHVSVYSPFICFGVIAILGALLTSFIHEDTAGEELEDTPEEHRQHMLDRAAKGPFKEKTPLVVRKAVGSSLSPHRRNIELTSQVSSP